MSLFLLSSQTVFWSNNAMCRKNCSSSGNKNYCNWYCVELCSLNFSLRVLTVTTVTLITINLVLMGTVIFIVKLFFSGCKQNIFRNTNAQKTLETRVTYCWEHTPPIKDAQVLIPKATPYKFTNTWI